MQNNVQPNQASQDQFSDVAPVVRHESGDGNGTARPTVEVDCQARMHVCQAICCKLAFPLTRAEVAAGKVKWDLKRPYFIRHEADGACSHLSRVSGGCQVYEDRPGLCRTYSCADDGRIWKDFEGMELNTEWLEGRFGLIARLPAPGLFEVLAETIRPPTLPVITRGSL